MSAESSREKLTIVVPVFNEEVVLPAVCRRLVEVADQLPIAHVEIIVVSDGSSDRSNELIRAMVAHDSRFQGLFLARNFGHQAAVSIGLAHATGDYVAVIDGDLQDPPELIAELLRVVTAGADVAYAVRRRRKEGLVKRALYAAFYRLLRRIADIPIPLDSGDFCCMRRRVLDAMLTLPERNRFVRGIRAWVGFKQVPVEYERSARFAGTSHYTLKKLLRLASDGLFGFSTLPVIAMQFLGFVISVIAVLIAGGYFAWYMLDRESFPAGFATLTISIWLLAGVQLLFLGLIGEYLIRAVDEGRARPIAIVAEHIKAP